MYAITINGLGWVTDKETLSYEDIVGFCTCGRSTSALHSITYVRGGEPDHREGMVWPGSRPVKVQSGTVFSSVVTDNA